MAWPISDHGSAAAGLERVRRLTGRLDLDHSDPLYQATIAEQLARAATDLAHDLRLLAAGRRLRRHLTDVHGHAELTDRQQNADALASDHHGDHRAGVPAGQPHDHDRHDEVLTW
jgi:hypothetical protein